MDAAQAPLVRPGDVVGGKYRVERVLGAGGMGMVVVARHVHFDDRVALKLLHASVADRPDLVARFLREGRAARQIRSEHVVQVTDVDTLPDGAPYLVMEYLEGADLAELLRTQGPLEAEVAIDYVLQACEALAEAHGRGIVHRDLKPANLFLTRRTDGSPCVKVLDFGISKVLEDAGQKHHLTSTATTIGTPLYMSPEQLQTARDVDARTDVWALGVILHELVTGRAPFQADTLPQLSVKIILDPPTTLAELRPDLPPLLGDVVARCLQKRREDRPSGVGELAMELAPLAPPRARISLERIARLTGLAPVTPSVAPPALLSGEASWAGRSGADAAALNAAPTVPFAESSPTTSAPSTMAGTTRRSHAGDTSPRRSDRFPLLAGVAAIGVVVTGGIAVAALVATRDAPVAPAATEPRTTSAVTEPSSSSSAASEAPVPAATTESTGTASAEPSASSPPVAASEPASKPTAASKPTVAPKAVGAPQPKPWAPAPSSPPGKSNEDY